ncbi:hypothetical protein [Nocardioides jensenii]|uniref:hypothetical protein n=1 Tax=Nocardioides jensenii TaxID=1843 RepID=UPI00082F0F3A|nr:hypothetical protein [Nocardioides jensenii]
MIETDASHQPFEVEDLEGEWLLDVITDSATLEKTAARRRLRLAYQLCVTHPVTPDGEAATWGDGIPGLGDYDQTLGGQGCPGVAAFTTELWATATEVSSWSAKKTLANTLDLHHRLPRTWAAVEALEVEAWRACRIAEDTRHLSAEAAAWVDDQLAETGRYGLPTIEKTIRSAVAKFHPDQFGGPAPVPGKDQWGVHLDHTVGAGNGTSRLDALGDSLDLAKLHDALCDEATTMGRLGDGDSFEQRKAKALGRIADRQATLDLIGLTGNHLTDTMTGTATGDGSDAGTGTTGDHESTRGDEADEAAEAAPGPRLDAEGNLIHPTTGAVVKGPEVVPADPALHPREPGRPRHHGHSNSRRGDG